MSGGCSGWLRERKNRGQIGVSGESGSKNGHQIRVSAEGGSDRRERTGGSGPELRLIRPRNERASADGFVRFEVGRSGAGQSRIYPPGALDAAVGYLEQQLQPDRPPLDVRKPAG